MATKGTLGLTASYRPGASPAQPGIPRRACKRCVGRWDFGPELLLPIELGLVQKLSTQSCFLCKFFAALFAVEPTAREVEAGDGALRHDNIAHVVKEYPHRYHLELNGVVRARLFNGSYLALEEASELPSAIRASHLDPKLVIKWLSDCDEHHGGGCKTSFAPKGLLSNLNLIDVESRCIVTASHSDRYVALSYMVGNGRQLKLTKANSSRLRQPGSLSKKDIIPHVVHDAIELTRSINQRFLWVDSLCIVQDDQATKHDQIMNMHTIYSRAILTLVSVSGDSSEHGLPGILTSPRPTLNLTYERHLGQFLYAQPPSFSEIMASSPYESRGWTFQERTLSSRCLYLTNWQAYFACRLETRCEFPFREQWKASKKPPEDINFNPLTVLQTRTLEPAPVSTNELLGCYAKLVESYTQRSLSFPSDILNAFAGISAALGRIQGTRFACGLPACGIEKALFWAPATVPMKPRQPESTPSNMAAVLPSWSWAAWVGPVSYHTVVWRTQATPLSHKLEVEWLDGNSDNAAVISAEEAVHLINKPNRNFIHQNALCFRAYATKLDSFKFFHDSRYLYAADAKYPVKWHCGVILDLDTLVSEVKNIASCELVMIFSSTGLQWSGLESCNRIHRRNGRPHIIQYNKNWRTVESTFVYVLLIHWDGDVARRLGVGAIHQDEWNAARSEQKIITLI